MSLAVLIPNPMLLLAPMLVLALLMGLSVLAFTTAHCAHSHGRSFWLWFTLGWVLPIVSFCILFVLLLRHHLDHGQRLLDDAKAILAAAEAAEKVRQRNTGIS
jgi:Trk-type K+ transport system membrane component